jgi:hypothetical protein
MSATMFALAKSGSSCMAFHDERKSSKAGIVAASIGVFSTAMAV